MGGRELSIDEFDKNLPECWEIVTIGEITLPYETEQPAKQPETEFKYIDIGSIDNSTQEITNIKTFLGKDAPSRARRIVRKDDILFSTVRTYLKNIARVPAELDGVLTSTGIAVLRCSSGIDSNFLFYSVVSDKFIRKISSTMDGTLYPAVTDTDVTSAAIVIPPLNEQRRIVAKIEALKARSQRVKEELEDIPQLLDQFRQSVLAAAFRGDLTADWREQNSNVEPAEVLFEKIQEKRKKWYEEECRKAEEEGRKKPKDSRKNKKSTHTSIEINDIPDTWSIARLEDISYLVTDGTHQTPKYQTEGVPFLSVKNVRPFVVKDEDIKFISEKEYQEINARCNPEKGDILYTKVGATFGYAAINQLDYSFSIFVSLALIKPVNPYFSSQYAEAIMNSEIVFSQARQRVTGIGTPDLHLIEIRDFRIPLPPLEEQQEIVNRVHTFLKVVNRIEQQYQQAKANLDQLDQSILAKAFRGELVPQDPDDEPASVLLEHIRAERAKLQTKTAKKSTTKTSARRTKKTQPQQEESVQLELGLE
ncbi:hypothetical protein B4U84_29215 [Westiellopsis prolifica IICB1]|nr:hypothetical protein B4U84_29215 [Westiellopsis prolifica IICB1]